MTAASIGELQIDQVGNTAIGMYRIMARARAYWIEKHQLPEDTKPVAIIAPWVALSYGQPERFLAGLRSLNISAYVGDPRPEQI